MDSKHSFGHVWKNKTAVYYIQQWLVFLLCFVVSFYFCFKLDYKCLSCKYESLFSNEVSLYILQIQSLTQVLILLCKLSVATLNFLHNRLMSVFIRIYIQNTTPCKLSCLKITSLYTSPLKFIRDLCMHECTYCVLWWMRLGLYC